MRSQVQVLYRPPNLPQANLTLRSVATKGLDEKVRAAWFVYLLECSDGSLYLGISNNVPQRVATHNAGRGPDYTRRLRPVQLIFREEHPTKSSARKREIELKGWCREKKFRLAATWMPDS